ncbi:iron complex transport system substrate-binding protein [Natranaerovirga pectinivora]|uniref:Iron complex transport system substrate-binding protein n=1 Tax=Natranaerovirga pectinivora TaxID=682400 RepID=A0A4R3MLW3_9FIRM|nr:ABC transporter substrate-binding protein [Natranaerovirga pectinivora]TCT13861.1 iron complex transport system substrate-binding protein [Natranaerovirga pectinivora]
MKNLFKNVTTLLLVLMLVVLAGCTANEAPSEPTPIEPIGLEDQNQVDDNVNLQVTYPLEIENKFGKITVIESEPNSVISFSPETTEIMFEINVGDKLIGRSTFCNYPVEASEIRDFGTLFDYNIESVVEANPDLVILSSMVGEDNYNAFKNLGLNVLVLDFDDSFEGTYEYITVLGQVFNRVEEAEGLIADMENVVNHVIETTKALEKPNAYFIVWAGSGDSTATGDTFIGEMMELAGANNVAADGQNWMYSVELLVEKDPDILIAPDYLVDMLYDLEGYKDLTALNEGRIYSVNEDIYYRQGPRLREAIAELASIFHPDKF